MSDMVKCERHLSYIRPACPFVERLDYYCIKVWKVKPEFSVDLGMYGSITNLHGRKWSSQLYASSVVISVT